MLDLLQKNPEATRADLAELEAATQPRRPPVIRASTLSERIRDKYYDLFESAARQPIGRIADALGLSDLQGIANERATGGKLVMATAADAPPGARTLAKVTKEAQAARALTGGFYSRVDEAAKLLPAKGVKAESLINTLKKASGGVSPEELELRRLAEFAASKRGQVVTPADLSAHLKANPAPFPTVKTLGMAPQSTAAHTLSEQIERISPTAFGGLNETVGQTTAANARLWSWSAAEGGQFAGESVAKINALPIPQTQKEAIFEYGRLAVQSRTANEAMLGNRTKFSQYQVPGGENYRETLLTLPTKQRPDARYAILSDARNPNSGVASRATTMSEAIAEAGGDATRVREIVGGTDPVNFRSSHFDDPNVIAHTRSNERTSPTGERGTFLEEVQSDWHQKGKEKGYRIPGDRDRANDLLRQMDDIEREVGFEAAADPRYRALGAELNTASTQNPNGVPDAPFKENWSDLSLKQALIDEANRSPDPGFLGFTGGKTQAARYDLSKQIDELKWYRDGDGYRISAKKDGRILVQKSALSEQELSATVGKDMAKAITGNAEQHGAMTGLDLQVGGKGMHEFYDKLLPKRLEKIMKPFGGTVEPFDVTPNRYTVGSGSIVDEPNTSWFSRLTPEIKARILKEGLPLMGLSGLTLGNLLNQEQEPVR